MHLRINARTRLLSWVLVFVTIPLQADTVTLPGSNQVVEQSWMTAVLNTAGENAEFVNRLALSESAYLRQHATNPIDWYPWSAPAFLRAENENRLILLSIGYASCHWCHVMEKESFADIEVATVLNQSVVSIKVDREQQPDIDAWFTMVVETIKGESGWPMTLILLPDKTPVFAANYLGKEQLVTTVTRLSKLWREQPDIVRQNAALLSNEIERRNAKKSTNSNRLEVPLAEVAEQRLLADLDPEYGGFGSAIKFPNELKLQFLLNRYKRSRDGALKQELTRQLDALMNGGLTDVVFGGVFRYATDRQMSRPHFEKMLYNQALSAKLFADAADWLENPGYRNHASSIADFVDRFLRLPDGTYAAAIDADHDGVEGGYYLWPEEIVAGMPHGTSSVPFGNGKVYIYGAPIENKNNWVSQLHQRRSEPPRQIENSLTAWNALWITALVQLNRMDAAEELAHAVWEKCWSGNKLFRMGGQIGFLDDYAYLSSAYWQLYLASEDLVWKERARLLDGRILTLFYRGGRLSYHSGSADDGYDVDSYRDTELPGPFALALLGFSNHQAELEFIEAYEALLNASIEAITNRPEGFPTLVDATSGHAPASRRVVANGHGMVSLRSEGTPGAWQIIFNLDENWHINASEVLDERLVPTRVLKSGQVLAARYPQGERIVTEFSEKPLNVYGNRVLIGVESEDVLTELSVVVKYQACSNEICLLPEQIDLNSFSDQ